MAELKEIEHDIRHAHTDMGRLNDLISRNQKLKQELSEASLNMEMEFQRKLKVRVRTELMHVCVFGLCCCCVCCFFVCLLFAVNDQQTTNRAWVHMVLCSYGSVTQSDSPPWRNLDRRWK